MYRQSAQNEQQNIISYKLKREKRYRYKNTVHRTLTGQAKRTAKKTKIYMKKKTDTLTIILYIYIRTIEGTLA